jgi:hypothetical protein
VRWSAPLACGCGLASWSGSLQPHTPAGHVRGAVT